MIQNLFHLSFWQLFAVDGGVLVGLRVRYLEFDETVLEHDALAVVGFNTNCLEHNRRKWLVIFPANFHWELDHAVVNVLRELGVFVEIHKVGRSLILQFFLLLPFLLLLLVQLLLLLELGVEVVVFHFFELLLGVIHGLYDVVGAAESQLFDIDLAPSFGGLHEQLLQLFVLSFELSDKLVRRRFVHHGLVLNLLGSVRISEGSQRFFKVHVGGRNSTNHDGLRITTQGILQNSRQVGVTIGNDGFLLLSHGLIGEDTDASSQDRQTFVNGATLLESLAFCTRLSSFFGTGEIDQIDDTELLNFAALFLDNLLELDGHDGVGPTRGLIHESGSDRPGIKTLVHFLGNHGVGVYRVLRQPLHIDSATLALTNLETSRNFRTGEEILHLLVVNLKHRKLDLVLNVWVRVALYSLEDLVTRNGNNTPVCSIADLNAKFIIDFCERYKDLPYYNSFLLQFDHMQKDNSDNLPTHSQELVFRAPHRPLFDRRRGYLDRQPQRNHLHP